MDKKHLLKKLLIFSRGNFRIMLAYMASYINNSDILEIKKHLSEEVKEDLSWYFQQLTYLDLDDNELTLLPDSIGGLRSLKTIR